MGRDDSPKSSSPCILMVGNYKLINLADKSLTLMLLDDHPLYLEGLCSFLSRQEDFSVVAQVSSAREAYGVVETHQPDVAVVDLALPGVDGFSATRELRRRAPNTRVLVLTVHDRPEYAIRAIEAGASGFVCKSQPADTVLEAIRAVARGDSYLPPAISEAMREPGRKLAAGDEPLGLLSPREREVFGLLVRGFTNQSVGRELCISMKTVETHRARIHRKLKVHSIADLMRFAARHNLIE
jgi:DNA-binding NarL/FixJ family response regulator